jgi:predicted Rossmann fold nucleotide-binding protein DprA/Smf involved in DNA uptake
LNRSNKKEKNKMTIKKDLQTLNKDIKALIKTVEKILKDLEKSEKGKVTKISTKRTPTKKSPAKKKTAGPTATDQVLKLINKRTKKGIDAATIIAKTGFNKRKVSNIIQRAYKGGKIKRVGKGLYVGS